jgi:iron(III) transport system substrate-binding protein
MKKWMKLIPLMGCMVFGATGAIAQPMSEATTALHNAARAEGELTWYVSHFGLDNATAIERAFYKKYPGVKVNVVRATAQVIYQRLNQDIQANTQVADLYSSTDGAHFVRLKSEGRLLTYRPENADKVLPIFRNMDPDNQYHATSGAIIVIAYRSDKIGAADAPKTWTDLLDPKFKGKLSFGHPAYSGYVGAWALALEKKYGWSYFEKLHANNPQIGRSINDVITMLDAGERLVGHAGDGPFRKKEIEGAHYRTVYPEDGSVVILAGSGILKNSKRPNAAKLFMDYLLDVESQQIRVDMDMAMALRPEVKNPHGGKMPNEVTTIPVSDDDLKGLPALNERWRSTFGG